MPNVGLPQDINVYRAFRNKTQAREPVVAFRCRASENEGTSILRADRCASNQITIKSGLREIYGAAELSVAAINAIQLPNSPSQPDGATLRCVQDESEEASGESHSLIINMPLFDEEADPSPEVTNCAELLLAKARILSESEWNPTLPPLSS